MKLSKHIYGALCGVAFGDAFGMPVEFWSRKEIKNRFPNKIKDFYPTQKKDKHDNFRNLKKHEVTDDTINTIAIAKMLIQKQGNFDTETYINFLTNWINTDKKAIKVAGPSTIGAIKAINAGADYHFTGRMGTTNGAIMKLMPLGVISHYQNIAEITNNVTKVCLPTH